ncbi:MAG: hypothetical protein RL141_937 [Candidatus Parcubacteria bacterium]|jgi:hypothetical protein
MLIQLILVLILAGLFVVTVRRAVQGVIPWGEALAWCALWVAAATVVLLPKTTSVIAQLVGVGRGVDAVVYLSITLLFVLLFRVFLTLDRLDQQLTGMVRREALRDLNIPPGEEADTAPRV